MLRLVAAIALAASFAFNGVALAATKEEKMETCKFGADDKKLKGAARKNFMAKCMSDKDSPRGKQMPEPKPRITIGGTIPVQYVVSMLMRDIRKIPTAHPTNPKVSNVLTPSLGINAVPMPMPMPIVMPKGR